MARVNQGVPALTPEEVARRRYALQSAIGSLRISGMELEPAELEIVNRFACGEIDLATMQAEVDVLSNLE